MKKVNIPLPTPKPPRYARPNHPMNTERTGGLQRAMPAVPKPKPKRKPRPGHNTMTGKYSD